MKSLAGRLALAGAVLASAGSLAHADDVSGYVEFSGTCASSDSEIGDLETDRETTSLRPKVNLLWNRRIFPNFHAQAGAFYERADDRIACHRGRP